MTTQTVKYLALSLICIGLTLSASLCLAQGRRPLHPQSRNAGSASSPKTIQSAQPTTPSYTYTLFDFPGTFYTVPASMNIGATSAKIEVVGGYGEGSLLFPESFLLYLSQKSGAATETYETVNVPGASQQGAFGVNDAGQIVGEYLDSLNVYHGWQLTGGTFTTIDVPFTGANGTIAQAINGSGEIAGCWTGSSSTVVQSGFTLIGGTYTSFDYPPAVQTCAFALNNKGDIAGYWVDSSGQEHALLFSGGTYTSIDPPGSVFAAATGINDAGTVVGAFCTTVGCDDTLDNLQGFLLSKGTYTTFTIAGAAGTGLQAINDKGVILGGYWDAAGYDHGFIAVP